MVFGVVSVLSTVSCIGARRFEDAPVRIHADAEGAQVRISIGRRGIENPNFGAIRVDPPAAILNISLTPPDFAACPRMCDFEIGDSANLSVGELEDYINDRCLASDRDCSVEASETKLESSCPFELTLGVRKTSWDDGAGVSMLLVSGEVVDLAAATSPYSTSFAVVP